MSIESTTSTPVQAGPETPDGVRFRTERLFLCEWTGRELPELRAIATDPRVMRYIGTGETWSDDRIERFIARQVARAAEGEPLLWKIVERPGEPMIGFCGLQPLLATGTTEIGWWLTPSRWGHGLATEAARVVLAHALDTLRLPQVVAIVQEPNHASRRVAERIGLGFVGIIPYGDLGGAPPLVPIAFYASDGRPPRGPHATSLPERHDHGS